MFEEAGVPYEDVCRKGGSYSDVLKYSKAHEGLGTALLKYYKGEHDGFPVCAPPVIRKGEFVLCQTPAILHYLGKELGMYPGGGPEEEAHALQVTSLFALAGRRGFNTEFQVPRAICQ